MSSPANPARGFAARWPFSPVAHANRFRGDRHLEVFIAGDSVLQQDVDYRHVPWDADPRREAMARVRLDWHIAITGLESSERFLLAPLRRPNPRATPGAIMGRFANSDSVAMPVWAARS